MKKLLSIALTVIMMLSLAGFASAACTQAVPTQAKELFMQGAFDSGHTYKVALYDSSGATLGASTTVYTVTGEEGGAGYSAGGATLTGYAVTLSSTTAVLDFADASWASSTITADCYMIYDSTLSNASCTASVAPWACCTGSGTGTCTNAAVYVGTVSSTSSTNGTWSLIWPVADSSTGLLRFN